MNVHRIAEKVGGDGLKMRGKREEGDGSGSSIDCKDITTDAISSCPFLLMFITWLRVSTVAPHLNIVTIASNSNFALYYNFQPIRNRLYTVYVLARVLL